MDLFGFARVIPKGEQATNKLEPASTPAQIDPGLPGQRSHCQ